MDGNTPQYGSLIPDPDNNQEEKKDDKKKKVMVGFAILALLGAAVLCVGTGYINDFLPQPTDPVPVVVEEIEEEIVEEAPVIVPPIITEEPVVVDVRDIWLGNYEGVAHGIRTSLYEGDTYVSDFADHDNALWLEIFDQDDCYDFGFCDNNRTWGVDIALAGCYNGKEFTRLRIFLPDDLSEAEGLTLTDSKLTIEPSEGHPYAVIIDLESGHVEGYMETDGIPGPSGESINWYVVDSLEADRSAEDYPCQR